MSADTEEVEFYDAPPLLNKLALEAMYAFLDDEDKAYELLERIHLGYGHQGLFVAVAVWADVALDLMASPQLPDGTRLLDFREELETVVAIGIFFSSAKTWAARLVLARADMDHDQLQVLYGELAGTKPRDGYLRALVQFAAVSAEAGKLIQELRPETSE